MGSQRERRREEGEVAVSPPLLDSRAGPQKALAVFRVEIFHRRTARFSIQDVSNAVNICSPSGTSPDRLKTIIHMTPVEAFDRRRVFCARLKSERERRGTSLAAIAEVTKVKGSLLEALERGDLSRWPKGIYRRAFFREYASAIGLPTDLLVAEFLDLFTDGEPIVTSVRPVSEDVPVNLRLTFADTPRVGAPAAEAQDLEPVWRRLGAAVIDILAVAAVAALVSLISPVPMTTAALILAPTYYLITVLLATSPGIRLLTMAQHALRARASAVSPAGPATEPLAAVQSVEAPTFVERLSDALRNGSLIREYVERLSESGSLTFNRQRQQELASLRRQRLESANRTGVDEISGVAG